MECYEISLQRKSCKIDSFSTIHTPLSTACYSLVIVSCAKRPLYGRESALLHACYGDKNIQDNTEETEKYDSVDRLLSSRTTLTGIENSHTSRNKIIKPERADLFRKYLRYVSSSLRSSKVAERWSIATKEHVTKIARSTRNERTNRGLTTVEDRLIVEKKESSHRRTSHVACFFCKTWQNSWRYFWTFILVIFSFCQRHFRFSDTSLSQPAGSRNEAKTRNNRDTGYEAFPRIFLLRCNSIFAAIRSSLVRFVDEAETLLVWFNDRWISWKYVLRSKFGKCEDCTLILYYRQNMSRIFLMRQFGISGSDSLFNYF